MLLYVPLIASAIFSDSTPSGVPYFDETWGWIAGALLQLTALIMLFWATRLALKKKNFVDRAITRLKAEGGRS
jgi:peptidoglycan biosynthesis protein MviN/MurJ (putative lipid II flippase)